MSTENTTERDRAIHHEEMVEIAKELMGEPGGLTRMVGVTREFFSLIDTLSKGSTPEVIITELLSRLEASPEHQDAFRELAPLTKKARAKADEKQAEVDAVLAEADARVANLMANARLIVSGRVSASEPNVSEPP